MSRPLQPTTSTIGPFRTHLLTSKLKKCHAAPPQTAERPHDWRSGAWAPGADCSDPSPRVFGNRIREGSQGPEPRGDAQSARVRWRIQAGAQIQDPRLAPYRSYVPGQNRTSEVCEVIRNWKLQLELPKETQVTVRRDSVAGNRHNPQGNAGASGPLRARWLPKPARKPLARSLGDLKMEISEKQRKKEFLSRNP